MTGDIIGFADRDGNMRKDLVDDSYDVDLGRGLSEQEIRSRRLIPVVSRYNKPTTPRIASAEDYRIVERENALLKIINRSHFKDPDEYNARINYYSRSQLPIQEIAEVWSKIDTINKRTAKVNRYTAAVVRRDENGLSSLDKQLAILDGDI